VVTKLTYGSSIYGLLSYNEDKVKEGKASFQFSRNFPFEDSKMSFKDKYDHFKNFIDLNVRTKKNAYHFSVNFANEDLPKLTEETKQNVVSEYMESIGLKDQPYLVYEHFDAAHPHLHVVTTNINSDGNRIDIYRQVNEHSEDARRALEIKYDLTIADNQKKEVDKILENVDRISYGRDLTKASLNSTILKVREVYKPTSIEEYSNTLLRHGVVLDRGEKGSPQRENNGLVYGFSDDYGNQVGQGIKASRFFNKPTFTNLEKDFSENKMIKDKYFGVIAKAVNKQFYEHLKFTEKSFQDKLMKEGIGVYYNYSAAGVISSIDYHHKQSGALYNSREFKLNASDLYKKFGKTTLSYSEAKELSHSLSELWREQFRRSEYSFESTFIKYLDRNEFLNRFETKEGQFDSKNIESSLDNFIQYKHTNFEKLYKKDLAKFNKYAVPLVRYLKDNSTLNLSDKEAILRSFDIAIKKEEGRTIFHHLKDPNVGMVLPKSASKVLEPSFGSADVIKGELSRGEKQLIKFLANRPYKHSDIPKNINFSLYRYSHLKRILNDSDREFIETNYNKHYLNQVKDQLKNGQITDYKNLLNHGLVVEPTSEKNGEWNYVARFYNNEKRFSIPVGNELKKWLNEEGITKSIYDQEIFKRVSQRYENYNLKYRLMSQLNEIKMDPIHSHQENAYKLENIYSQISKQNKGMANEIAGKVEEIYANQDNSAEIKLNQVREVLYAEIESCKDPEIGNDHILENSLGNTGSRSAHPDNIEPSGGGLRISNDDEEERRRRKLLKKFYDDLER